MQPTELPPTKDRPLIPTLRRFLPYLWPAAAPALRVRIVVALTLVVISNVVQVFGAPFALAAAIRHMSAGSQTVAWFVIALVALSRSVTSRRSPSAEPIQSVPTPSSSSSAAASGVSGPCSTREDAQIPSRPTRTTSCYDCQTS